MNGKVTDKYACFFLIFFYLRQVRLRGTILFVLGAFDRLVQSHDHATCLIDHSLTQTSMFDRLPTVASESIPHLIDHQQSFYAFNFWSCFASLFCQLSVINPRQLGCFPLELIVLASWHFIFNYKKNGTLSHCTFTFCAAIDDQLSETERQQSK